MDFSGVVGSFADHIHLKLTGDRGFVEARFIVTCHHNLSRNEGCRAEHVFLNLAADASMSRNLSIYFGRVPIRLT